ncbi:MAG: hypothetical protein ACI9WU_003845 [Myxococcota bacterium]|jgi:hypothetical protein
MSIGAAVFVEPALSTDLVVTEIHSDTEAHVTRALELGRDGMTLRRSPARTRVGRFVWLEFALGGVGMRVLAEVVGRSPESTRINFKHFWPQDRARYVQFLSLTRAAA